MANGEWRMDEYMSTYEEKQKDMEDYCNYLDNCDLNCSECPCNYEDTDKVNSWVIDT